LTESRPSNKYIYNHVLETRVMGMKIAAKNRAKESREGRTSRKIMGRGSEEGKRLAQSNDGGINPIVVLPGSMCEPGKLLDSG